MKQGICHDCEVTESQANTCEDLDRKSQVLRSQQQCRRGPVWNIKCKFNARRPEMRYHSVVIHLHFFQPSSPLEIQAICRLNTTTKQGWANCIAPCPRAAQPKKTSRLAGCSWLLPALPMRQRRLLLLLLLTGDEGGAPHRAAVAVSEPTHGGRRWVRGTSETMVRFCLCGERRG